VLGNLIANHWTIDWDVVTIIEALEELYPLQAENKHLDFGSRWQQEVDKPISRVRVQSDRMEQVRSDTIYEWSSGASTIGPIPRKTSSSDRGRDQHRAQQKPMRGTHCMGCNRPGHPREDCHNKDHPDFNHSEQLDGCKADRELRARGKTGADIKLMRKFRSDETEVPRVAPGVSDAPSLYRRNDTG
jgi:hypothetical protein